MNLRTISFDKTNVIKYNRGFILSKWFWQEKTSTILRSISSNHQQGEDVEQEMSNEAKNYSHATIKPFVSRDIVIAVSWRERKSEKKACK